MDALARLSSDAAEALRIADDVLAALAEGDSRARVDAWRVRGQALRALALHADAVESFANAAAAARAMGDELLAAQVQVGSIDSLAMLGRFDDASALAGELERAFRAAGADDAAGKTLYNLGAAQLRQERYRDALESFERAGVLFAASPNADQLLPHVQTNTALALTFLDRTDEALVLYASARESFAERDRVVEASVVDANVGFVHAVSGRFVDALASLNRARDAFAKLGRFHEAARYEIDAGDAYRALNLRPEARACYDRALETFRPMESELDEARALLGRAATLDESSAAEIDESLDRAQAIFAAQRVGPQQAQVELLKAIRALRAGREDEARSFARSAGRRFSRAKLAGWAAEASLIALDAEPEVPASARLRRLRRIRRVASRTGRGWLECRALLALGRVFAGGGKTAFALRCFRTGVAILEGVRAQLMQEELHSSFLRDKLDLHEALIGLLLARGRAGDINEAFEQVERARSRLLLERVLSTAPDSGAGLPTALPTALSERLVDLRARISRAYHREIAIDDSDARRMQVSDSDELDALERQYRELLRDAEIESKASGQSGGLLTAPLLAGELCGQLAPGSCLIEYCAVESRLHAFVVTCDRVVVQRDLCGVSELEGDLRRLRFHLQSAASCPDPGGAAPLRAVQGVLKSLHQRLITPLLESVPCGTRQVTIIPHGVAHGAPFHALFDGDCYLCDRWQITQAPSAALWLALKKRPARPVGDGQSMLLMGVPDPGIAQVSREIERLADAAPGARAFCGADATLATFFAEAPEHRVLHLATHGLFRRDNPLFSGLRFADGWLLARDLYGLRLGADLVTLSACRTGVVEVAPGEELFGLVRGFVAAGARTLVASLWAADDAATASLMVPFYARLRAGCAPAAALQDAQRTLRATFPNPYHWAPFFVIGAP